MFAKWLEKLPVKPDKFITVTGYLSNDPKMVTLPRHKAPGYPAFLLTLHNYPRQIFMNTEEFLDGTNTEQFFKDVKFHDTVSINVDKTSLEKNSMLRLDYCPMYSLAHKEKEYVNMDKVRSFFHKRKSEQIMPDLLGAILLTGAGIYLLSKR